MSPLHAQVLAEISERASALAAVLGPDMVTEIDRRVAEHAGMWAAQLASDDDRLAARTVIDLGCVLWPTGTEPPAEWWRTPLGRAFARSLGTDDTEAVTHSVAAAMLGVTKGTIAQLVHRGTLDRHPDGGVLRASVMQRLAR